MDMRPKATLKDFSTMRLGGAATYATTVTSEEELVELTQLADEQSLRLRVIGGGSNILFDDSGFDGIVAKMEIPGIKVDWLNEQTATIEVGAGVDWDEFVAKTVELGLQGVECLSLIPGTVGAAPVQNIGAYGQEVSQTITKVRAYDRESNTWIELGTQDCSFGYRTSVFKHVTEQRYLITSVVFTLKKGLPVPPFYKTLEEYLAKAGNQKPSLQDVREAVVAIRSSKLPDPKLVANCGSFYKNPIVSQEEFANLQAQFPDIPHFKAGEEQVKIQAGWLVEQAGFKGYRHPNGMGVYDKQSLVVVNYSAKAYSDLKELSHLITDAVSQKYGIDLEQEPELLR